MPTITTRPDLTRTRAAIAAYDAIDAEITDTMTQDEADDFFKRSDAAKLAVGEAFALDTSDRNDPEVARSWAAFNIDRTREFVAVPSASTKPRMKPASSRRMSGGYRLT